MLNFCLKLTKAHKKSLIDKLKKAQDRDMGDIREAKFIRVEETMTGMTTLGTNKAV